MEKSETQPTTPSAKLPETSVAETLRGISKPEKKEMKNARQIASSSEVVIHDRQIRGATYGASENLPSEKGGSG